MENAVIVPAKLAGRLTVPPSKSMAHRLLICAALANGKSLVENVDLSQDISATVSAMRALGSYMEQRGNGFICSGASIEREQKEVTIDCCESGSTLRFLIPIALAFGGKFRFCHNPAGNPEEAWKYLSGDAFFVDSGYASGPLCWL